MDIDIRIYRTRQGKEPLTEWLEKRDALTDRRVRKRLARLRKGNFGDCKSIGGGLHELRLFFGPGYRVYFVKEGNAVILLLCGGDKSNQNRDIAKAREYWNDHKERHYD